MSAQEISLDVEAKRDLIKLAQEVVAWWQAPDTVWCGRPEAEGKDTIVLRKPAHVQNAEKILSKYASPPVSS